MRRIVCNVIILRRNVSHFAVPTAKRLFLHNKFVLFFLGAFQMAGHPLLQQVRTKNEPLTVGGKSYQIIISYNQVIGIDGYVVGLKFADEAGSMDSARTANVNGLALATAVAYRAVQMIKPDLPGISILGFYLLTDEIDKLRPGGGSVKMRVYSAKARIMRKELIEKLQHLTEFEVVGGAAWVLSEKPHHAYDQFTLLERELAKQMRVALC